MDLERELDRLCREGILTRESVNRYEVHDWYGIPRAVTDRLDHFVHVETSVNGGPATRKWFATFIVESLN